jgi:hypothetical protein
LREHGKLVLAGLTVARAGVVCARAGRLPRHVFVPAAARRGQGATAIPALSQHTVSVCEEGPVYARPALSQHTVSVCEEGPVYAIPALSQHTVSVCEEGPVYAVRV